MAKLLQITDIKLVEKISTLKGKKTVNEFILDLLNEYENSLNSKGLSKKLMRRSEATKERKSVNHTELFQQILLKAKTEFTGKKIPISYFTSQKNNGIATLHYDVVKTICTTLNIDLKTYAIDKKTQVKI